MAIANDIQNFLRKAQELELLDPRDTIYVHNRVLSLLKLDETPKAEWVKSYSSFLELLDSLVDFAVNNGAVEDFFDDREVLAAKIMDVLLPRPSEITRKFESLFATSPKAATDDFYEFSKKSNYIQTRQLEKNLSFPILTNYGRFDITVNLSKPEKDPREIERQKSQPPTTYPKCLLCLENEGYAGHAGYPARTNHRVIPLVLDNEEWFFQYSPYLYYNEHCIVFAKEHRDMKVDQATFRRLLAFTERFPHYFLGSNADLPLVGGSILSHDHYQGGRFEFAMERAPSDYQFALRQFPHVRFSTVTWPMSVIRLDSASSEELILAGDHILRAWRGYSDQSVKLIAKTGETPHNTITPIARRKDELWELDLVLRNNRCDDEYPLGIFHPHDDVHHIKKENIGLIEVMGLAVLPARLATELKLIEEGLMGKEVVIPEVHRPWFDELVYRYGKLASESDAEKVVREEVGAKFQRVLEDAGIFKRNTEGKAAFRRFLNEL